jgi:hypothetical protein
MPYIAPEKVSHPPLEVAMFRILRCSWLVVILLAACQPVPQRGPLEGAWEMVSGRYTTTNPDTTIEVTRSQIKILTATHFAFGRQSELGAFAGGGRYTLQDSTYTEIVEYHSDTLAIDQTLPFNYRLEGDSLWYHSGNIGPTVYLEEVWRRIEH